MSENDGIYFIATDGTFYARFFKINLINRKRNVVNATKR